MAKAGRKRKIGDRYPSGDLKRPTQERLNRMAADLRRKEQSVVLAQPHRGGRVFSSGPDIRLDVDRIVIGGKVVETVIDKPDIRAGRIGSDHKWASSAFGRFCLRRGLREPLYDAGHDYANIVSCWRGAKGVPRQVANGHGGSGAGPSDGTVRKWQADMMALERAMMVCGIEAFLAVRTLVLDEADIGMDQDEAAIEGLKAIAVAKGRMRENEHPFAGR